MEILEITLSIAAIETIIAIIMLLLMSFGAPYLVRKQNKKYLDQKADKEDVKVLVEDMKCKANKEDVKKDVDNINFRISEIAENHKKMIETMGRQIDFIYQNEMRKGKK